MAHFRYWRDPPLSVKQPSPSNLIYAGTLNVMWHSFESVMKYSSDETTIIFRSSCRNLMHHGLCYTISSIHIFTWYLRESCAARWTLRPLLSFLAQFLHDECLHPLRSHWYVRLFQLVLISITLATWDLLPAEIWDIPALSPISPQRKLSSSPFWIVILRALILVLHVPCRLSPLVLIWLFPWLPIPHNNKEFEKIS